MKLLSIAVPCYNSEAYMATCIESLLVGGNEVEILIVDDGSKDGTAEIADRFQSQYPGIVRAIHQPNKGHGGAVNTGIENATGAYFKVVDSDDRVKASSFKVILDTLRDFMQRGEELDLLISNFVYNKEGEQRHKVMHYRKTIPTGRVFSWDECGHFKKGEYILMHSVIYRTQLLRACGIKLPEHTFYVDNIYVFDPLPYVKTMYYLDINFYYYYIGREDQSVNEKVMISRLDQQARVNRIMVDYFVDPVHQKLMNRHKQCYQYMYNYLEIITTITSTLAIRSKDPEKLALKKELWDYIENKDAGLYKKLRHGLFGTFMNIDNKAGYAMVSGAYRLARRIFNFN